MTRLLHLSDLHFGRERPELLRVLIDAVNSLAPDLVVISGDLTQRATEAQFRAAATFVAALDRPVLSVPGNHDVPLHNLLLRLTRPWRRYRKAMGLDLQPHFRDANVDVIGVNTVDQFAWQRGKFRKRDMTRTERLLAGSGERVRVIVAHHPLWQPPEHEKVPMKRAREATMRLAAAGVDIYLAGHLHSWMAETLTLHVGQRQFLQVQAGTGLSTRVRNEPNDFNLIELRPTRIRVLRHVARDDATGFDLADERSFSVAAEGWSPEEFSGAASIVRLP